MDYFKPDFGFVDSGVARHDHLMGFCFQGTRAPGHRGNLANNKSVKCLIDGRSMGGSYNVGPPFDS